MAKGGVLENRMKSYESKEQQQKENRETIGTG
jgi:hypothetical protein